MAQDLRSVLLASARLLLRPIVRVLLRGGVPFREFAELAKFTYVEIATNDFGIRGRPTNVSRTAILTGLNRRDVARIRSAEPLAMLDAVFMSHGSRILSGWHLDAAYLDAGGIPLRLPLEGGAPSFQSLARQHAPDLPYIALFKELSSAGAVELGDDGHLRVLMRSYIPKSFDPTQIRLWGSILHDMASTLAHNVARPATAPPRFERRAIHPNVRRAAVPAFHEFVEREGQQFLERVDAWLARHGATADLAGEEFAPAAAPATVRLGAGAYLIEEAAAKVPR
ncbi:MAG TPA: DUF6502 family protein [Steroidobacteraceae bacterium]|nr:DUF6502 family protein [Steroidobacteraceae bacterium]